MFFANVRTFREQVRRLAWSEPTPVWIVVAAFQDQFGTDWVPAAGKQAR